MFQLLVLYLKTFVSLIRELVMGVFQLLILCLKAFVSLIRELVMGDIRLYEGFWQGLEESITRLFQPCVSNSIMEHSDYAKQRQEAIKKQIKQDTPYTVIDQQLVFN
jgi:hypothetical protein